MILMVFLSVSCHDELEKLPISNDSQDNFYTNLKELNIGLVGAYSTFRNTKDGYGEAFIKISTHGSHAVTSLHTNLKQNTYARYTFDNTEESLERVWRSSYKLIYRTNQVIDRSESIPVLEVEERLKTRYIAEAKFLRALCYFNLVRFWGDIPLVTKELTNLSDTSKPRTSADLIYDQIIEDLKFAEENLYNAHWVSADTPSYSEADLGRATIGAAKGLLSKVYLTRATLNIDTTGIDDEFYTLAYDKTKEVMLSGHYELDPNYGGLFKISGESSHEWMFQVQFDDALLAPGVWGGVNNPGGQNGAIDKGFGRTNATYDLINSYEADDPRLTHNVSLGRLDSDNSIIPSAEQRYAYCYKYRFDIAPISQFKTSINAPVLRYADIVLVFAEACARIGGLDTEMFDALDLIRSRARGTGTAPIAVDRTLTGEALYEEIFWERARELCFEGKTKFDVMRFGVDKFMEEVSDELVYKDVFTGELEDPSKKWSTWANKVETKHILYPIPESEMRGNSLITDTNW